jgi:hypothetical protein
MVWKRLRPEDLAAFRAYLEELPAGERPLYGLIGIKASWWSRLGGGARPFVVLFSGEKVTLSKRSVRRHRELSRRDYPVGELKKVSVRRGPLLESARLSFADGYSVRVGSLPRRQAQPVERFPAEGPTAFEPSGLTAEQLTNTYLACDALGLLPTALG